jgi:hypothetical protein
MKLQTSEKELEQYITIREKRLLTRHDFISLVFSVWEPSYLLLI